MTVTYRDDGVLMTPSGETSSARVGAGLAELLSVLLSIDSVGGLLDQLAQLSVQVVTPASACGITLRRERQPMTVASSNALAGNVDEVQYEEHSGPCLEALQTGQMVLVESLETDTRWPTYAVRALDHGIRSSMSIPLVVDAETTGALNLYATTPAAFGPREHELAGFFAEQATAALSLVIRHARQTELSAQLRAALSSRAVIDQAIGIVMAQQRRGPDEAFAILRTASQHRNVALRDIAGGVVASAQQPTPRPGRPSPDRS